MGHPPQIPLTPQTDERNFPQWKKDAPPNQSGHPYPRMLTRSCTREDREAWRDKHRKVDTVTRQEYWEERLPKVGDPIPLTATLEMVDAGHANVVGEPVIVADAIREAEVFEALGLKSADAEPVAVEIPLAALDETGVSPINRLIAENERLRRAAAEKKPARRKRRYRRAAPRRQSLEEFANE